MELLLDPNMWVGLLTLIVLEIVLGIDNLVFIAILADKLPPQQRDKARLIGLSLALIMRLALLSIISWLVTLTAPLFSVGPFSFSGRDLILLLGGIFLLVKATTELHERLEGKPHGSIQQKEYASFGIVIAQIVALDAVFSLDSVITAVGMVDELAVMMTAVIISIALMMWASKPLTRFVSAHPTVIVLCLSFLLMIGLSLVADGLGFHIPKGYLYAAIGFSILIEFFNQVARRSVLKNQESIPLRDRTADAVLRMLGGKHAAETAEPAKDAAHVAEEPAFGIQERSMVSGVLSLAERSIQSIMTPRADISWINLDDDTAAIRRILRETPHSFFPVCRGNLDNMLGVARAKDLMADLADDSATPPVSSLRDPVIVHETVGVLGAMDTLKQSQGQLVLVVDEYGTITGLLTPIDVLEAIAGEFPDEDERPAIQSTGPDRWRVDGAAELQDLARELGTDAFLAGNSAFSSVAGFLLTRFGALPDSGDAIEMDGYRFEVVKISNRRIVSVDVTRRRPEAAAPENT
ncbi:MAG TPA: TerC family protein [Candidimonas sp.]|nr:TerC family protein [Candidimonas sp.]